MNKNEIKKLIIKYSMLLVVYYFALVMIPIYYSSSISYWINSGYSMDVFTNVSLIIKVVGVLYYLIVTLVIVMDYRKYKIKPIWLAILTLFYMPIGICIFFVNIFIDNIETPAHNI
ncbi:MAG: hypothetical protein PF484_13070 [Bacteroidales bacterium]|jgi:hypothetical protein|nr:hypothetical protein [Bacteroidales bacterium]